MEEFLTPFNLSNEAIDLYLKLYGKNPLSLNEAHLLKPNLSKKELVETFNELFQAKLLLNITPEKSFILGHYIAIPPLYSIFNTLYNIKEDCLGKSGAAKLQSIINNTFKSQGKIELDNLYKDFQKLQKDVNRDITTIKEELDSLLNKIEGDKEKTDFLEKYEAELKNIINSQLASIAVILLQMKASFQDKLKKVGISNDQWNALKNEIKDILGLGIHEKSKEIEDIISEEFVEIKNILADKYEGTLKEKFESKSVHLGILNIFKNEIDKFHKALLLKKNNISLDLSSMEKIMNAEIEKTYHNLTDTISHEINSIENTFIKIIEDYSIVFKSIIDFVWPVKSRAKIYEEILNLLKKSKSEIIIIIPNIENFIPINQLNKCDAELDIKIISSDPFDSEIVNKISVNNNIEFKRLENNNFIGILSDSSYLIIGAYFERIEDPLENVIGIGTSDKELITLLKPQILEKYNEAKPPKEKQINEGFNYIIENINEVKGRKISKILQDILDVAFEMEGISLDVLELKLLIGKLRNVNVPLNNEWKKQVINKIEEFNRKFSTLELNSPPEFKVYDSEVLHEKQEPAELMLDIKPDYLDDVSAMFDLLLEKIDNLKGFEISNLLGDMMEIILKFQGFSNIIEWKENLNSVEEELQEPFIEKFKEEMTNLKVEILSRKATEVSQDNYTEHELNVDIIQSTGESKAEEDYYSPALAELEDPNKEDIEHVQDEESIKEIFLEISQNLNEITGSEISKKLQEIMDIVLETKGYSMALKDMRQWISKLKMIKSPLTDEVKSTFKEKLQKWKIDSI
jgi:hypothetical protein